jgi:TolB protein
MRDPNVGSAGRMMSRMSNDMRVTGSWLTRHAHALKPFVATVIAAPIVAAAAAVATGSSAGSLAENGRIAFGRYFDRDKNRGVIFTVARSGRGERQVTHPGPDASDFEPDWSPDGSRITFTRSGRSGPAIYTVRPDGSGLTKVSRPCRRAKPRRCDQDIASAFSPSGRDIAFASSDGRLKPRSSSSGATAGTDGSSYRRARVPSSSTLGSHLTETESRSSATTSLARRRDGRAVFVVNVDGSGLSRVTPWNLDAGDPDWSPDGRWILFGSNENLKKPSQLYLIRPDGTHLRQLTRVRRGTLGTSASFSPDGNWIVFAARRVGGNADLYVMRANGTGVRPLTRTRLWDSAPDWGAAGVR